ncbi:MAG: 4Fe-4S cluster-binding domain-containing protein [Oscillospiraceae bacterium]|nr:4Fe-4S cluster-binding domain-containing protein [Oscillospiraceae bacterium]
MNHPYKTRAGGATVTVFVPYDCRNNCPFCVNKQEYANCAGFSVDKIIESIRVVDSITPACDVVFTGGEPFANLDSLQRMLDVVPETHKVYINTTFPVQPGCSAEEMLTFTERNKGKITCINVSRHIDPYVEESPDEIVGRIATPKRINCVLYMDYPSDKLKDFAERWRKYNIPIQFRYDYTETTPENLYEEENDRILQDLKRQFTYMGLDGCRMRNGFHFLYKDLHMTYHKTLPYSTIVETDENGVTYDILYDILIKQTGELHSDWTGVKLDVEKYRNVVFEPYDLKVLDGTIDF